MYLCDLQRIIENKYPLLYSLSYSLQIAFHYSWVNFYCRISLKKKKTTVSLLTYFKSLYRFTWRTAKPYHVTKCCGLWGWQQVFCWVENPSGFICFSPLSLSHINYWWQSVFFFRSWLLFCQIVLKTHYFCLSMKRLTIFSLFYTSLFSIY